jgi:hypothetical protein
MCCDVMCCDVLCSYARGYAYQWEYFHAMVQPLATTYPYMVSIGVRSARSTSCGDVM